jgi:hypothetical protein
MENKVMEYESRRKGNDFQFRIAGGLFSLRSLRNFFARLAVKSFEAFDLKGG